MDSTSINLVGSKISSVTHEDERVTVRFKPAYIEKTMTGSLERTRWWQHCNLVFDGAELDDEQVLAVLPADCAGGDVGENVYTYRDMVPLPLESRGRAHCVLQVEGSDLEIRVNAEAVTLEVEGVPKYIEHIRPK